MGKRRKLKAAIAAMDAATSYSEWRAAAEEHDRLSGAAAWRDDDDSIHYDASSVRASVLRLETARESGDGLLLAEVLTEDLHRHLNDFWAPALYDRALTGTKRIIERYLDESVACLRWLAENEVPHLSKRDKRTRFETAYRVFGRSALLLSGGGTWGFHHLGVVKALFELDLLPHILSGASTGAMVAAGVCGRSDDELRGMYEDTNSIRLDGLVPIGAGRAMRSGGV